MWSRSRKIAIIGILLILSAVVFYRVYSADSTNATVYYSLDQKANDQEIIHLIQDAKQYVYFAIYTFTKDNIADALIAAKSRGVDVRGITDLSQSQEEFQKPLMMKLAQAGINLETQKHPDGIMHIKALVTEQAYASGSFNWTSSATTVNDEVLEVGKNQQLHDQYYKVIKQVLDANQDAPAVAGTQTVQPAAGELKTYRYTEAPNHIGETASVTGKVLEVFTSSTNTTFFDFCTSYKTCPFTAVIFASDKSKFANLSQYNGAEIKVTGPITSYQGRAEIILSSPAQIVK